MASKEKEYSQIILKDETGRKYILEFNRRTVERMEDNGFKLDTERPMTMVKELFTGAFQMHFRENGKPTPDRIMEIWDMQKKKDDLLTALTKMYLKPMNDMMAEPEGEDDSPTWETA